MSNKLYEENDIQNIANAIRNKNGTEDTYKVSQMSTAINSIEVIEQATAEGESLNLANTKAMPYSDYVVKGKSEQETRSGKNLASDVFNEYSLTPGPYGYKKLIDSFTKTYLVASLIDNDTSVDMSGIYLGFTASGNNYTEGVTWLIQDGTKKDNYYTNNKPYLSFYPTNTTTFNKIFQRYKIQIELSDTLTPTSYEPYGASPSPDYPSDINSVADNGTVTIKQRGTTESNDYVLQTSPLRSLPNGVKDTIEADGIHRRVGRRLLQASDIHSIVTTGTVPYVRIDKLTLGMVKGTFANNTALMKSYAITGNINYSNTSSGQFNTYYDKYFLAIFDDRFTDLATAKQLLEGEEIIYELATEAIEPLTQNQATTMLDIIKTGSYEGTTNIYTDEDVKPTMKVGYYKKS